MAERAYLLGKNEADPDDFSQLSELTVNQAEEIQGNLSQQRKAKALFWLGFLCPLFWVANHFVFLRSKNMIVQKYVKYSFWCIIGCVPLAIVALSSLIIGAILILTFI